jgi:cytochrome d ubiquinol oxidase subunit II
MISLPALQMAWYVLLCFLLAGFVVMGGTDLGAGLWYLCARPGSQRNQVLQTVAPFWDGNQVWLVAAGGAAFAAFPPVYAAVLSGLYPLLMLLLLGLILRTVAIDYAHKEARPGPRAAWDVTLGGSSILAVVCFGLLIGNLLRGLPLDARGEVVMSFGALFNPWALLVTALLGLMVALHGAVWLARKTEGEMRERARRWGLIVWGVACPLLVVSLLSFALLQPRLAANYARWPGLWALPVLALLAVIVAGAAHAGRRALVALLASSAGIALVFATAAAAMYPDLVPALTDPGLSLTAHNASASQLALLVMLGIMVVFLPLVLAYTSWLHWLFREPARPELEHE